MEVRSSEIRLNFSYQKFCNNIKFPLTNGRQTYNNCNGALKGLNSLIILLNCNIFIQNEISKRLTIYYWNVILLVFLFAYIYSTVPKSLKSFIPETFLCSNLKSIFNGGFHRCKLHKNILKVWWESGHRSVLWRNDMK